MKISIERTFTLTLDEREATILCALLGYIAPKTEESRVLLNKAFEILSDNLPNREESYSDFFED